MGGGDTTKTILKTVAVDILPIMINEVQSLLGAVPRSEQIVQLGNLFDPDQEYNTLTAALQKLLEYQFMVAYGYNYNGADSQPPYIVDGKRCFSHAEFVNTSTLTNDPLNVYVEKTIVDGNIPAFCKVTFANQLLAFLEAFLVDSESAYQVQQFDATYTDKTSGDAHSVDALMCFSVKNIDRGQGPTPYLFLSYIGVHYPSIPQFYHFSVPNPIPSSIPVVRIGFAASTVLIGTAVAAYIWRLPPAGINVLITGPAGLSFKLVISKKNASLHHKFDSNSNYTIDTTWVEKALQKAGIKNFDRKDDVATAYETQELEILSSLEN